MLRGKEKSRYVSGRLDALAGGRLTRLPAYIRTGGPVPTPIAWYDAADVSSFTIVSNLVSQWNDKMGSFNATAGVGDRPAYDASPRTINGIICPEFVSSDRLASGVSRSTRTCSVFAVGLADSVATTNHALVACSSGTGGNEWRFDLNTGQQDTLKEATAALAVQSSAALVASSAFIAAQVLDATTITHWLMVSGLVGLSKETDSDSTTFTAALTALIGSRSSGGDAWDGLIGELIFYDRALTSAEAVKVIAYLAGKWGIAGVT